MLRSVDQIRSVMVVSCVALMGVVMYVKQVKLSRCLVMCLGVLQESNEGGKD